MTAFDDLSARQQEREFARVLMVMAGRWTLRPAEPRCAIHRAFDADYCPACGTAAELVVVR